SIKRSRPSSKVRIERRWEPTTQRVATSPTGTAWRRPPADRDCSEREHAARVALEVELGRLGVESERVEVLERPVVADHGVVGAEEDLAAPAAALQVPHELGRQPPAGVRRGVDVDVLMLAADRDHLLRPWVADVAAYDDELREVDRDLIDIGDRPTGLGGSQRTRVANLGAERHPELHTLGVQRVVAAIGRR